MSEHLSEKSITAIIAHRLDLASEVAFFKHWKTCDFCQLQLRPPIDRDASRSHVIKAGTILYDLSVTARWPFKIISTEDELLALTVSDDEFGRYRAILRRDGFTFEHENPPEFTREIGNRIRDFMEAGKPYSISEINLSLVGSIFARQVLLWTWLVPFGQVATYGQIARWLGKPAAARGVGGTLHRNPIALAIPCHRIIGTNGSLVGFGGGLDMKRKLLDLEGSYPQI